MLQDLRQELSELELRLDLKAEEVADKFTEEQLKAYFRSKDAVRMLIPSLADLEIALYENKIALYENKIVM